jgi:hypothetical protein
VLITAVEESDEVIDKDNPDETIATDAGESAATAVGAEAKSAAEP